jgi:hypothetical protein
VGELTESMAGGDKELAKKIVNQSGDVLQSNDVRGRFGEFTAIMGGDKELARKVVNQSPSVLKSGDVLGRFGELTAIMGGDKERARKVVNQSPAVLWSSDVRGRSGELTAIMGGDKERAREIVDRSPDVLMYSNLRRKFEQLVEICGSYDGARALVAGRAIVSSTQRCITEEKLSPVGGGFQRQTSRFVPSQERTQDVAVLDYLFCLSCARLGGVAISEVGFSTEISPEIHSLCFDASLLLRARFGP